MSAAVAPAGKTDPVIGPADVNLAEGTAAFVHAVGSLDKKNLQLVSFTVSNLHGSPNGVSSGAPSGAPADEGVPGWMLATSVLGLAVIGVSARRRSRAHGADRTRPARRVAKDRARVGLVAGIVLATGPAVLWLLGGVGTPPGRRARRPGRAGGVARPGPGTGPTGRRSASGRAPSAGPPVRIRAVDAGWTPPS